MAEHRFYRNVFLSTGNCNAQLELLHFKVSNILQDRSLYQKFMTNPFIKPYITHPDLFSDPSKITFSKKCITFGILYMKRLLITIGIIDMSIQVTATIFEPTTTQFVPIPVCNQSVQISELSPAPSNDFTTFKQTKNEYFF